MADVDRGNRPLSPHLTIYNQSYTGTLSIMHRITGVAMTLGMFLLVWWLMAAATDASYFDAIDGLMTSWIGLLVWFGLTWALCYHFLNGIRHLMWDTGQGMDLPAVERSGQIVLFGSAVMTLFVWIVA